MKWILVCIFLTTISIAHSAEPPHVGIVISWDFKKGQRSVPYQQKVWQNLLGRSRMFVTEVVEDNALRNPEALRKYRCLVLPSSRFALSGTQVTNLVQYVRAGGKLIRDQQAVSLLGRLTDEGWDVDAGTVARESVASFWRNVGGVENGERMLIHDIRFLPEQAVLAEFLPAVFKPVEALCDAEFDPYRNGVSYRLVDARAVAEARPDAENNGMAEPQAIITIRPYGAGQCLSLGINIRGLTGLRSPMAMYRDFSANLMYWIVE